MNKWEYRVIMALLASMLLVSIGVILLMVKPYKTVTYNNLPFPILNEKNQVKRGEYLKYEVDYCRHTEVPVRVIREFINGVVITLPEIESKFPMGCHKIVVARTQIPQQISNGPNKLILVTIWDVNPFKQITEELETEEFIVID